MHSQIRPRRYVIDASVVVKWHFFDEDDVEAADAIRADFAVGRVELIAPIHIRLEVPNAIRRAMRRGRLSNVQAQLALRQFLSRQIGTFMTDERMN